MTNKMRILIAEDSSVLGDVIRFNLQRSGFEVTLARNGEVAFQALASERFDVLITDFEMPVMNGEELSLRVRTELKNQDIHIIMCSAKGIELDREGLKSRLRIEEIFFKPFSIRDLTSFLQNLVSATVTTSSHLALTN
jgi:DNA-binding response OmpR family regulator